LAAGGSGDTLRSAVSSETPNTRAEPAPASRPKKRWSVAVGHRIIKQLERLIAGTSPLGDPEFFDPADFPWVRALEANWRTIRGELDGVLTRRERLPNFQDISTDQRSLTQDDRWKTFVLYGYGYKAPRNCARCPETARLVEQVPGMLTAFFSILAPGKHIPSHRGPYKGVIRYHLALMVPEPRERCRLRVGGTTVHWEEGKSLVFDDTYKHEVWNDTSGTRVVLFMDVLRPLPFPLSALNRLIIALIRRHPFIQDARRNLDRWERDAYREDHPGP